MTVNFGLYENRIIPFKHFQSDDKSSDPSDDQEEDSESLFNIEETNFGCDHVDKDDLKIEHDGESDDDSTVEIGKLSFTNFSVFGSLTIVSIILIISSNTKWRKTVLDGFYLKGFLKCFYLFL